MSATIGYVTALAQYGLDSILVKPKRSIGEFRMQVVVEEVHHDELEITDHPVEQGAVISDHAYKRPAEVVIRGGWSDSPSVSGLLSGIASGLATTVTGIQSLITGNSASQVRTIYAKLLKLQESRVPIDVYTGKRVYTDMLIKALSVTTDAANENQLMLSATLRQVLIVRATTNTVSAPASAQANPAATQGTSNSGTKQLIPSNKYKGRP